MKKRSYRVSEEFISKLSYLQDQSKIDGIPKNQEQLFDEMINLYMIFKTEDRNIFLNPEIEKQLININELFLTKQAQLLNSMLEHIDNKFEEIKK